MGEKLYHKTTHVDEEVRQSHELFDMIDRPANTKFNNYTGRSSTSQVQPKSTVPTQPVIELQSQLSSSILPTPSKEERGLECEQQENKQGGMIDVTPVEENLSIEVNRNKLCTDIHSEIETGTDLGIEMEHSTILEENSIPKPHSNTQINNDLDIGVEAMKRCTPDQSGSEITASH